MNKMDADIHKKAGPGTIVPEPASDFFQKPNLQALNLLFLMNYISLRQLIVGGLLPFIAK